MTRRTDILKSITTLFNEKLDGTQYTSNISSNAYPKLKFWDEVQDFPSIYIAPGTETREYMPSAFTWAFFNVSIKVYCKGESSQEELDVLIEDIEDILDSTLGRIEYATGKSTEEISIHSITTDEGLLQPYAVGEINILVRYPIIR
jgi:hypothetical protein